MNSQEALTLARRFAELPQDRRRLFLQGLREEGIDFSLFPIPAGVAASDRDELSYAQRRMWFLWQLEPESAAYNLPCAVTLRGRLNEAALERAFDSLVARHETLRTVFPYDPDRGPRQAPLSRPLCIQRSDLRAIPRELKAQQLQAIVEQHAREPFDLAVGPLLRIRLVKLADDEHALLLCLHHIVSDGWSMNLLIDEFSRNYQAYDAGDEPALATLPIQYGDYALWQRRWMEAGERERQLAHWRSVLGEEQPVLQIPSDRPRPSAPSYRGARHELTVEPKLAEALRTLAARQQLTLFTVLLAGFDIVLHRYSGQTDIRVGVPIANRHREEVEGLIGCLVNTQVIRAHVDGQMRVDELLSRLKEAVLAAQAHQDLPFEQLVEALQPERTLSHSPLFQVMYNHQPRVADVDGVRVGRELVLRVLERSHHTTQFDLSLDTYEQGGRLHAALTYATDLFDAETVQRFARHWLNVLNEIAADSNQRIGELAVLSGDEAGRQTAAWNETGRPYPSDQCVPALFRLQAERTPDAIALVFGDEQLTYAQLNSRANQLAHKLIALGVGPDVRVGAALERSSEMVVGLLAILKAGGAYVPLDPEYPVERITYMLEDSGVQLLLTQSPLLERLPALSSVQALCLDRPDSYAADASTPGVRLHPENLAYVIYTSGSTGRPKGAGNRHVALTNRLWWMQRAYGLGGDDAVLQKTPFSFDVSVWEFFWPLMTGARLVVAAPGAHREPSKLIETIRRHAVTTLHFVPSMLQAFLLDEDVARCTSIRRVVCSGEALPVDVQQQVSARLPAARLYNLYGPTEAAIDVTHWTCDDEARLSVPIGRPIDNLRVYVVGAELEVGPIGASGELLIGGAGLARGYHGRAGLTAERFIPDPFSEQGGRLYRTGDLARYRNDGVIEYVGRIDHQVKIRGFRIELGEIEARLQEHDRVREAVVVAQDGPSGKQLVGYIVTRDVDGSDIDAVHALRDALRAQLRLVLPEHMVPSHLVILERLPLTPNGKLDRNALPKPDASAQQETYVEPRTDCEKQIASIWADVLKLERVGLLDNFFELGGDSIVTIQVVSRARQVGIRFTPKDLFQHQTVQGLAAIAEVGGEGLAIDQGPVEGELALLPIQRWFFEQEIPERHHWNQSVVLTPTRPLSAPPLESAIRALIEHHDALRLSFRPGERGWTAVHRSIEESRAVPTLWAAQIEAVSDLERLGAKAQQSLELETGSLVRAVLVQVADGSQRLVLAIHHLVVDGVSWRVLLEDLQTAYGQGESGRPISLPAKTSAYKVWAEKLQIYAESPALQSELTYWEQQMSGAADALPCDHPEGRSRNRDARTLYTKLDAEHTKLLLQRAPAAYRTQINDLLLTALARVIGRWTGRASTLIQLEGHGREELFDDVDVSRTVGWFTTMYPVRLTLTPSAAPGDAIKAVKEQLRAVPSKGIGFGLLRQGRFAGPQITFNYLGQFDDSFDGRAGLFAPSGESAGPEQSLDASLQSELSIDGQVFDGKLSLSWKFSGERFEPTTIQRLADDYCNELEELIAHCCDGAQGGVTPSDFPLVTVTQPQLDALPVPAKQIEDLYPLSPMQQGLLLHTLLEPRSGIYYMQDRYVIDSEVDLPKFTAAWRAVVRRHDALRASFSVDQDGRMLQIIHRDWTPEVMLEDWSQLPWEEHEPATQALLAQDREKGFALLSSPPLVLRLFRRAAGQYWFVLAYHHILMDAWCRSLVLQDFFAIYRGESLPPAGRYRDFIAWREAQGESTAIEAWRAELHDVEQITPLPFDRPVQRQKGVSSIGDRMVALAPEQGRALYELAQGHQLTVNTFAQAAWALVLHRYSGLYDVLFGVTVAGRPTSRPEMQHTVGLFINSIPLRVRVPSPGARVSVRQWLQDILAHNYALREHEHLSLVQIQASSSVGKGLPLFDSLFVYESAPLESGVVEGAQRISANADEARTHTNYPITVVIYPGEALGLHLSYDRRFFEEATIDRLLADFKRLLLALYAGFHGEFAAFALVGADEYETLRSQDASTQRAYPLAEGYAALFERQVDLSPERVAASCLEETWSYRALDQQANRVAHALVAAGVAEDQPVALFAERGLPLLGMMIGSFKAGAGYLALDPHLPDGRLVEVLHSACPPVLLTASAQAARASALIASLPEQRRPVLLEWDAVERGSWSPERPGIYTSGQNLAYVIYTSGSTGKPKGVLVEQAGMLNNQLSKIPYLSLGEHDVIAQTASQSFDISVWQFLTAALSGARVEIVPNAIAHDPAALLQYVAQRGITVLESVPSLIQGLLDEPGSSLPQLRWMLPTGEAMPLELARRWLSRHPEIGLVNAYGPAECSDDVALYRVEGEPTDGATLPIGFATDNNKLYVLNGDLRPVPLGVVGELYVSGIGVGRGYLHDPVRTAEAFLPNPLCESGSRLYRTGDLARYRSDGALEYVGRIDQQVKIRGFRIELGEIEARLRELDGVRDAAVEAQEGPAGRYLIGYVVPVHMESEESQLQERVRTALKAVLPDYMVPAHLIVLTALPLTPNGKLDRKALPKLDASGLQKAYVEPRTTLERQIAAIWGDVLKLARVGLTDNFFALGGHSLLATQVVSRVKHQVGREVGLRSLFEADDLGAFVGAVERSRRSQEPPLVPAERVTTPDLSYAQQRQWFLWQLEPNSAAYHLPVVLRLRGKLDVAALQRAFAALVRRHETLRTTFSQEGERAIQVIQPSGSPTVSTVALGLEALDEGARAASLQAWLEEEISRPFDLEAGPLLRVELLRESADAHVLVLVIHHIVSDGWSMEVMVEELVALYASESRGQAAELAALPVQYADYALWQRRWMEAGERDRQLGYWQEQLGGTQPVLELPLDRARPAVQSHRGAQLDSRLDGSLSAELQQLAQCEGVTVFMLMLASFQALLYRYSGQSDIRVGVPIANRSRVETERLIGFFVNTQVLRAEVDGQSRFVDLLRQVKGTVLDAQVYQDLPFEQLVEALQPARSMSHAPLFQVMMNHQIARQQRGELTLPGLEIEALATETRTAQFDLTLDLYEAPEAIQASFTYATDLFDRATIERLAAHWRNLLRGIVADPAKRVGALPLLEAAELRQQLVTWNQPEPERRAHRFVHQRVEAQAERRPDAPALMLGDEQLTYRQLNERANGLASRLIALGVGPEVRVGVATERSLETIVGFLATLKAGGAYVPLDPEYPADRLRYMLDDSGVELLLTQSFLQQKLPIPAGVKVLCLDRAESYGVGAANPAPRVHPDNLAYVIYTSGSTGKPKGVAVAHGPLAMHVEALADCYATRETDSELQFMSFAFDGAHEHWLKALTRGARMVLRGRDLWTPEETYAALHRYRATVTVLPPVYLLQLAQYAESAGAPPAMRIYCFGGDAVPDTSFDLAKRVLQPEYIINGYGPTETVVTPLLWKASRDMVCGAAYAPIGTRVGDRSAYVLDANLELLPLGRAGELYLGGYGVARGYHGQASLTADRFVPDPFREDGGRLYRSGDLTRLRPDGVVDYLGRVDYQVKVRGFRIELGEIEARLQEREDVRDAVVVAHDGPAGKQLVGYVVPREAEVDHAGFVDRAGFRDRLRTGLKTVLPDYMVPSHLLVLTQLPVTPNGKLDRNALPQPDANTLQKAYVEPRTALQRQVGSIWAAVLKLQRVGLNDNFFELGGHSLLATQVASRVRQQLGVEVALRTVFEAEDLAAFVEATRQARRSREPALLAADRSQPLPLSYAQYRQWFLWQLEPHSAAYNVPIALRLQGALAEDALRRAFDTLIARHETLRTTLARAGEHTFQVIHPHASLTLDIADVNAPGRLQSLVEEEIARPFDLESGPLLRVKALREAAQTHVLLVVMHHVVSDAWSMRVMVEELVTLYAAYSRGEVAELPSLPIQYADYALWQRNWMEAGERDRQLAYWVARLGGEQPVLELPLDRARPAEQSYRGAQIAVPLESALGGELQRLAQREGATLFMVLLASFQALLHRYCGQNDIRVGVPVANRNRLETERLIGFFVNTQVLKAEVDSQMRFDELLTQVKQTVLDAQEYQDLPFEQLVEALQPERSLSYSPLFQVLVNHQVDDQRQGEIELPGLRVEPLAWDTLTAQFDLALDIHESPQGIHAAITYATDLFDAGTIERLAEHWQNLLRGVIRDPQQRVGELPLQTDAERRRQLTECTRRVYPLGAGYASLFERQVDASPERVAASCLEEAWSYRVLDERANRVAHALATVGVVRDSLVAVLVERDLTLLGMMIGSLKAGAGFLALDPHLPDARLREVLASAGPRALLTDRANAGRASELVAELPTSQRPVLLAWEDVQSDAYPRERLGIYAGAQHLAYGIYTSGSTGKPKGVLVEQAGMLNNQLSKIPYLRLTDRDVIAQTASQSFDISVWQFLTAALCGARVDIVPNGVAHDPAALLGHVRERGITVLESVPSMIQGLLEASEEALPQLRWMLATGEAMPPELAGRWLERHPEVRLINAYGPAECSDDVALYTVGSASLDRPSLPIGVPTDNNQLYILSDDLQPLPIGAIGELYVSGIGVGRGYLNDRARTADAFLPNPFGEDGGRLYRTGDLARYRPNDVIEYVGRRDHQVKIRGFRIELGEIEAHLQQDDEVRSAVVVAQDGPAGKQLVGYVVPLASETDEVALQERLRAVLRAALPEYMVPAHLMVIMQLPLTPNGKLDRKALPKPDAQQAYVEPETDLQRQLASIWADVLTLERVGLRDNFFDLGGHSLLATQMISRMRERSLPEIPIRLLFQARDLEEFSAAVQASSPGLHAVEAEIAKSLEDLERLSLDELEKLIA